MPSDAKDDIREASGSMRDERGHSPFRLDGYIFDPTRLPKLPDGMTFRLVDRVEHAPSPPLSPEARRNLEAGIEEVLRTIREFQAGTPVTFDSPACPDVSVLDTGEGGTSYGASILDVMSDLAMPKLDGATRFVVTDGEPDEDATVRLRDILMHEVPHR